MKRILGSRANGKTTEMVKSALKDYSSDTIVFVVGYKDYVQGIVAGLNPKNRVVVMSYNEFIEKRKELSSFTHIFIDEVEGLLRALSSEIEGYTLGLEKLTIKG